MKTQEVDPLEKKKRLENYKTFMNRGGPDAPGSKTIPDGAANCLKNLTFVISGEKTCLYAYNIRKFCFYFFLILTYFRYTRIIRT